MGIEPVSLALMVSVAASAASTVVSLANKPKGPKAPVTKPLDEQAKNRMPMGGTLLTGGRDLGSATTGTKTLLGA